MAEVESNLTPQHLQQQDLQQRRFIAVVHRSADVRAAIARPLAARGFDARGFDGSGLKKLTVTPSVVVIADRAAGDLRSAIDAARMMDAAHVIAVVDAASTAADADVDDFVRAPVDVDELVVRIDRLAAFARKKKSYDWTRSESLASAPVWRDFAAIAARELAELLARPFAVDAATIEEAEAAALEQDDDCDIHVRIAVTVADHARNIAIDLRASRVTMDRLARAMIGDESAALDADALADVGKEMLNVVAGGVKRAALADGNAAAIGLPTAPQQPGAGAGGGEGSAGARRIARQIVTLRSGDASLVCTCALVALQKTPVAARELQEGMVTAGAVNAPAGALLVPTGTRLTSSIIGGLARHLGARSVEVFDVRF